MKILLVYPKYPDTFWSFSHALKFISKKASFPPLGLLTVSALLPPDWEARLVDMNVRTLRDEDIRWADYVFISAMAVQRESAGAVIRKCNDLGRKVVAGGPLFTAEHEDFEGVDHFVLGEAEVTLPPFVEDARRGEAGRIYSSPEWADLTASPVPARELVAKKHYSSMNIQYSRGCPYDCEFCNITVLYGRVPRTKTAGQVVAELESIYRLGWRGGVFFVDDNFIGNRGKLKREILPAIIRWSERKGHPFEFSTEASINLADDEDLMRLMVRAGFITVFVGIESPNEESLQECSKIPNKNRDLVASVKKIQGFGLEVQAGFIVGFDMDPASIFERISAFIHESSIVTAMVGLLNAPRGTRLYQRLKEEGRLLSAMTGDNTDFTMNFIPRMNREALMSGYQKVINSLYSPREYYSRVKKFLKEYNPKQARVFHLRPSHLKAFVKSLVLLGVFGKERVQYWKLFFWSLFRRPRLFPLAITLSIYGFHFRKIFEHYLQGPR